MARELAEVLRFGRYEPLFRIGIGGMAEVYAARILGEGGFQKQVAVKRMLPHLTGDRKFVDMFLDEARLAANVSSPHVVQTLDLGRAQDDSLYIVMELIVGVNLGQVIVWLLEQGRAVDPLVALEILSQAAQGLDDAHEARTPAGESMHIVHRDVSPQNILIGIDGRARVGDFGIAHALYLKRTHTNVGEKKGKFSYFSPEQALGGAIDRRTDVFALGVVAWELLTGQRLFKGSPTEAMHMVQHKEIPRPHTLRPELGEPITRVLMKALERDPEGRFQTAADMSAALRRAAIAFGDPPTSRDIGRFVAEVGGENLERVRDTIARADRSSVHATSANAPERTDVLPAQAGDTQVLTLDDVTWVPGDGATSLLTGERTFTGPSPAHGTPSAPIAFDPTMLLEPPETRPARPGAPVTEDGPTLLSTRALAPTEPGVGAGVAWQAPSREQERTGRWLGLAQRTGTAEAPRRSRLLLATVAGLILVGLAAFGISLIATRSEAEAERDAPSPDRTSAPATAPAGPGARAAPSPGVHEPPSRAPPPTQVAVTQSPEEPAVAAEPVAQDPPALTRRERQRRAAERRRREREARGTSGATAPSPGAMTGPLPSMLDW